MRTVLRVITSFLLGIAAIAATLAVGILIIYPLYLLATWVGLDLVSGVILVVAGCVMCFWLYQIGEEIRS